MATGSHIQITNGGGPFIATGPTYTEASTTVQDQKVISGLPYLATYRIVTSNGAPLSTSTANSHLMEIMAGASLNVYVHHIWVRQFNAASASTAAQMDIYRLTSAGSNGTAMIPQALDLSDGAAGATCQTLPSSKGTESGYVLDHTSAIFWGNSSGATALICEWDFGDDLTKMLKIAAGTSNGIAVKNTTAVASATVYVTAEIIEAPF